MPDFHEKLAKAVYELRLVLMGSGLRHGPLEIRLATERDGSVFQANILHSGSYPRYQIGLPVEVVGVRFTWPGMDDNLRLLSSGVPHRCR